MNTVRGLWRDDSGQDRVEYTLLMSLIALASAALFLGTSREAKYMGKTAIDSFFWRAGDALSALVVFVGSRLAFDIPSFARANAILSVAWMGVAATIVWLRINEDSPEPEHADPLVGRSAHGNV